MKTRYRSSTAEAATESSIALIRKPKERINLGKATKDEGRQIVDAKNQAERQPMLHLQLAKAYLAGTERRNAQAHMAAFLGSPHRKQARRE